jgi:hypothetical protein
MMNESKIDNCLNRLSTRFSNRALVRPRVTSAALAESEGKVGALPSDLTIFLSTYDGLRVAVAYASCVLSPRIE